MKRQDFLLLVGAVRIARERALPKDLPALERTVRHIADHIERELPKFDKARFLTDCGISTQE